MSATAFVYDPVFLEHKTGPVHPESPQRLEAIVERLNSTGVLERCLVLTPSQAPVAMVTRVHSPEYVRQIADLCATERIFQMDEDTVGSRGTYRAALTAAGAVWKALDSVMVGQAANAFCAVRPPGHHALHSTAMGFCFFNNAAIAARYVQDRYNIRKVAIIDWDVHHGNGTQEAFYDDPSVFYFSTHQYPHYPGTGRRDETGTGAGKGFTLNVPMAAGSGDTDYLRVFRETLRPAMDSFKPEVIVISAGFDAHEDDALSGMVVTTRGFELLTREVFDIATRHCGGRLVSVLEGGYHLAALASSVLVHMKVLMGG